jgi:membrane associated rhomboid family serine protease/Flp pilus assembly protein TadD
VQPNFEKVEATSAPRTDEAVSAPQSPAAVQTTPPIWQSATFFLIAINVAVFLIMVLKNPSAFMQPTNQQLLKWGADFGPLTLDNQPWRVITSGFLHIGIIHIAVNMWSLWILGKIAERFVGPTSLVAIYLLTGVGASLASLAWDPVRVSAGASGPIFGFIGAMIGILYMAKDRLDPVARKRMLNWVVRIAVINLFIGLTAGIDNMAHAGGLVTGIVIGALLVITARNRTQDRGAVRRNIFVGTAIVLALLFVAVRSAKHDIVYAYRGEVALENKDFPTAINHLKEFVAARPNDPDGHATLGYVYQRSGRYPEALDQYKKALAIKSDQPDIYVNIAIIDQAQGQTQEAIDLFSANLSKVKFDAESYKSFGEALLQNHEAERAENQLRSAIKLDDKDPETHSDLAKALRMQGKTLEANTEDSTATDLRKQTSEKQVKP